MQVFDIGGQVRTIDFIPCNGRLLAGTSHFDGESRYGQEGFLHTWALSDASIKRVELPDSWYWEDRSNLIFLDDGKQVEIALGGQLYRVDLHEGTLAPTPEPREVYYLYNSPAGDRQLLLNTSPNSSPWMLYGRSRGEPIWESELGGHSVAGFLPDGDRFVTLEPPLIYILSFADGGKVLSAERYLVRYSMAFPQLSTDGRYLGTAGRGILYICDLTRPGEFGKVVLARSTLRHNLRSFAFHPTNGIVAVIDGGGKWVKFYDVSTLKLVRTFNWKLGLLTCVAFSPDGLLAAAGSETGNVVVWDVDG